MLRAGASPSYRAEVWSAVEGRKIRKTFSGPGAYAEARAWRAEASNAIRKGTMRAPTRMTVREAGDALVVGMRDGSIRNRSGDTYKPSAVRSYEQALRDHVYPSLGGHRLSDVALRDVQALVDRLVATGLGASTVRNALMPLRVLFKRAVALGDVAVNATAGVAAPAVRGRRDRIASPVEAAALLAALPDEDRAVWGAALYAGLRRGELMALRVDDMDLSTGVLRVERSYDPKAREWITPKSRAGVRRVPIASALREHLIAHKLRTGRSGEALLFGRSDGTPFDDYALKVRADRTWKAAGLSPIGLHESRHTFASLMIAAGVNIKALSTYMGHASITITMDRYGHLMPGNEVEAAGLLDAYLNRAAGGAR
jgi:integrase